MVKHYALQMLRLCISLIDICYDYTRLKSAAWNRPNEISKEQRTPSRLCVDNIPPASIMKNADLVHDKHMLEQVNPLRK